MKLSSVQDYYAHLHKLMQPVQQLSANTWTKDTVNLHKYQLFLL